MAVWLKQSTATVISFGPFVDKTDGVTPETGLISALDHASTGIMLSKSGGAFAVRHATVTATTYDAYGNYLVTLDTTDTNTLGVLRVQFIETATCLPVWQDFMVLPANVYDSLVSGSDTLQADVTQIGGDAQSATDLKDFADAGYDPGTNKVQGVVLVDTCTTNTDMRGTDSAYTGGNITGDITGNLSGSVGSVTGAVGSVTGNVGGNVTGSIGSLATQAKADVNAEADAALADIKLDHLINAAVDTDWATTVHSNSVIGYLADVSGGGNYNRIYHSLYAAGARLVVIEDDTNTIETRLTSTRAGYLDSIPTILADTAELQTDWADGGRLDLILDARASQTSVNTIDGIVDDILLDTAEIANLNDISTSDVNAQVVDALATDTYAEPGQGAPAATTTLAAKINYLYKAWRNKSTQTATQYSLYADDASTVDQKATCSDDATTFTKGETATGP